MRNLKRVLSLTLASVMLLGMMVIGSSAAQDYSDVDYDNDNIEAIEVLDAINVMRGDLDDNGELAGTFRPGSEVKRSEMARIMAFLMDLDYDYYVGVNPFTDMVGHWAEKYAAACAANGIIYGRTTGPNAIYDPDATVTAVEAASMLMRALGYFQNPAVDQPNGFEIDTIRQAGKINLFKRVDAKTNEPMTRNDVAQLVLNALQSGMVEPSTNSKIDVTVAAHQSDAINLQGLPSGVTVTVLQKATISNIPKGVSVIAIDDVVLAGTVSSGDIVWAPGVKVDLADGATVSGDAKDNKLFKDKNGNPISGKVTGELTFENDTGSVIASTQAALDAVIDLVDKLDGNTTAIGEGLADELANVVTGGEGGASGLEDAVAGAVTTPPTADVVTSAGLPFTVVKPTSDEIVEEIGTLSDGAKQEYSIKLNDDSVDIVATKAFDITAGSKLAGIYGGVSDENKADKVIVWKVTGLDYDNGALYRLKFDWASNGEDPVWVKYDKNYGFQKDASTGKGYIIFNTGDKEPTVKLAMVATPTENELTTGNTGSMSGSTIYSVEDKNVIEINIDFDHADATGASS